ncbi:MAG: GNAT family N-acetyltransferase [Nitrococcus sp.]|nr:GNAT family N-acetyltransferase [Nitrococcus sp.]
MKILKEVDRDMWWEVAMACPYATFFHSPLWHQLASETYREKQDASIAAVCDNSTRMVLPLLQTGRRRRGLFRSLASTFAGCYGGVIADGPISKSEVGNLYTVALAGNVGRFQITSNPIQTDFHTARLLGVEANIDVTQILALNGDFDAIKSGFSKGHNSSIKKGHRMGVTVRQAESLDDYRAYYSAYEDSLRRWKEKATSCYPWRLFENGFRLSQEHPQHIKLWLAEIDQKVIAGAWVFYWNNHADWWHGAAYEEYFNYYPNNVLQVEIIRDALTQGYKYYDFNPSGGHDGVARFKGRFGADEWPIMRWAYTDRRLRLATSLTNLFQ